MTSLERRLASRTWLLLHGEFSRSTEEVPTLANPATGIASRKLERTWTSWTGELGVRQALTTEIVELSVFATLFVTRSKASGERLRPGESTTFGSYERSESTSLGARAGISVERELIEALALRLAAGIVSASWSEREQAQRASSGTLISEETSQHSVSLGIEPSLQLRFYF